MLPQHNIFQGDHDLSHGYHVTIITCFHAFQLDNHSLSLHDRLFISPMSHAYNNYEMLSSILIQNFLANLSPTDFQISYFIFRYVPHKIQIHKYDIFLPIVVWLNGNCSYLWAYFCFHIQDHSSCNFNFNQPNNC
jgi:hypothetical protein